MTKTYLTPEDKAKYLAQLQAHFDADEIMKGKYWEYGKGCAVGCILHSSNHSLFEELSLMPEWLGRLIDRLFEGLPNHEAKEFPLRFLQALPTGKDGAFYNLIKWKFLFYVQTHNRARVLNLDLQENLKQEVLATIDGVLTVLNTAIKSKALNEAEATAAATAAEAVEKAAWSESEAESESESESESEWESEARSKAWAAARAAAAWSAARAVAAASTPESAVRARSKATTAATAAATAAAAARAAARAAGAARPAEAAATACKDYAEELLRLLREHND